MNVLGFALRGSLAAGGWEQGQRTLLSQEYILTNVRILVADDHELVRSGLRKMLEAQQGWEVVGEATDGLEAIERAKKLKPDVVVIDFGMPRLNGLEAVRRIVKILPETRILVLSMHDSDELSREMSKAGAHGYLTKSAAAELVVSAVEALRRREDFFPPSLDRTESATKERPVRKLTSRQQEIVRLVAKGRSTKEAARLLRLSPKTVETHRANIMKKLGCHSVGELIRYAIRNGIIDVK